jgi:transposase
VEIETNQAQKEGEMMDDQTNSNPAISINCPACGEKVEKTQRELNLYGMDINCPNCNHSIDASDNND